MKQLKFRAWDKGTKKWLLGYEYPNLGGFSLFGECMLMGEWGHILNNYILNYEEHGHKEDDLIVMQFTGLCDKNGKEIYEGDILIVPSGYGGDMEFEEYVGIIKYDAPEYWIKPRTKKHQGQDFQWCELEIIGNIHENPELLN